MAKISKAKAKAHSRAQDLIHSDTPLKDEQRDFIIENWNESANHMNGTAGAHFTPYGLARDFCLNVNSGSRVLDLCAGIGALSLPLHYSAMWDRATELDLTCVEINADYVTVGKRIAPWATWICAPAHDVLDMGLEPFEFVISNPPFGSVAKPETKGTYKGSDFEFHIIELASKLGRNGAFIVPQMSAPFKFSGQCSYEALHDSKAHRFMAKTGINLEIGCAIDTSVYRDDWKTTSVVCEILTASFDVEEALAIAAE